MHFGQNELNYLLFLTPSLKSRPYSTYLSPAGRHAHTMMFRMKC